jgi:hypothetical protein
MRLDQTGKKHARRSGAAFYGEKRMDEMIRKDVFEVIDLHEADDSNYWLDRSPVERIEAIEFMRKVMYGHDRVSERLQRVLTIAELKEN